MKNVGTLRSAVIMMMMMMVSTASTKHHQQQHHDKPQQRHQQKHQRDQHHHWNDKELLKHICEEASALIKNTNVHKMVHYKQHQPTCLGNFFCRVEKSLDKANIDEAERLNRYLKKYNSKNNTECKLPDAETHLTTLLNDTIYCATQNL